MADILVRGLDDEIAARLKEKARQGDRSLNDLVKSVLIEAAGTSRSSLLSEIRDLRKKMGRMPDTAMDLIREDRNAR